MGFIDCIVKSKLADKSKIAELEQKVKSLVDNGTNPIEAERIVKNEYILSEQEALNTELNTLKKSLGVKPSKLSPQQKADTTEIEKQYQEKLAELDTNEQEPPPPAEPPKVEQDTKGKGQSKDKGVLSHLHSAKNIPEESRNGFEREGLKYETKSQQEAEAVAKSVIDKYGIDEAVSMAERMMFDGDVNSLIFAESLNRLSEQESKATTEEEKMAAAERFAEVGIAYDKLARYGGRFNAAINYFYKKSPLGVVLMENAKRKEDFDDWAKNKEKSWKEAIKDPEFEKLFKEKVEEQLKTERTETRKAKREKVHKAIDDTMAKWAKKFSANLPEGTEKAGASIDVFKAAAATMKAAYDAGEAIGKVIQDAIDYISKETGVNDWDKNEFKAEWEDILEARLTKEQSNIKRLQKELDNIRLGIVKQADIQRELSDKEKELKDEIFEEKKKLGLIASKPLPNKPENKLTPEEASVKRKEKQLEDLRAGIVKQQTEKRELSEQEKKLNDEIFEEKKKLGLIASKPMKGSEVEESIKRKRKQLEDLKNGKYKKGATKREIEQEEKELNEQILEEKKKLGIVSQQILDRFRKRLKGLTEKQKDSVIQRSYIELITNDALNFEDLRNIIAEVVGKKELTTEEQARMKELVNKVNSIEKAAEAVRTERTQEARDRFREVQKEASFASKELSTMFYNKPDIIKRLNSIMILGTLGPVSLVVNITYNIWNQLALRFPVGVFNTLVDLGLTRSAKLAGSEIHQEYNVIKGQAEFWSKLGTGLKESFEQIKTGLNRMDYTQKEVYQEAIRPFDSLKDLWKNAKGETNLTRSQWWDKFIQGFPLMGMYAEGVARALNIGDKPQRFAAQGAQAASFAKGLGLKGIDYDIFIDFPRAEAYRVYKALGKTDEEAMTEADVVERAIVREGERATFQQDNLLNDKLSQLFGGKNSGIGGAIKSLAVSPYVKIPSNAFWSYYNLINPEVAAVQSAYLFKKAHDLRQKNEMADARMSAREARYWLAHMVVGMSMRAVVLSMVKSGMFVPASDEDDSKKEREAMSLYDRGGTVNIGGVKVANKWFAQFGMMGNAIAKKYQDMTPEQKENQETFWNTIFGGMEADALKELENGIFANSSSLLQWYSTGKPDRYLMNTINLLSNILQPAGIAQINRARIDYVTSAQGDTFMQKLNQNFAQRSTLYRNIFDVQLKYKRDIWGQKIPKEGNTLSRMFGISKDNPKIFARPVYNDYLRTMDAGFLPPIAPMKLNDKALTTEQYEKLQNYVGAARIAYIEPYVNGAVKAEGFNEKYSEMSDSRKKFALSYWYDKGLKVGKEKFYKEYPELIPAKEDVDYVEEVEKDIFRTLQNLK